MKNKPFIYFLLCCGCVTISFNVAALTAALPSISIDLGLSPEKVSIIIRYYMLTYGLGALFYAPLTRKINYRRILAWSMFLYAASSFFCAQATSIQAMVMARVLMGLSAAGAIPLGLILIGQLFDKQVRGRLVGLFFGCSFIASIAGIICSGVLPWRWLFFVPSGIGLFTAMCFAALRTPELRMIRGVKVNYLSALKQTRIRDVFLFIFVISFLFHGVRNWFGVYLDRVYGLDRFWISVFYVVIAFCGAVGQAAGGFISDKKGRFPAVLLGIVFLSAGTITLALRVPDGILLLIMGVVQMGWTVGHNGVSTVLTDFPDNFRPEIASLNSAVRFLAGGVGLWLSTPLVEKSFELTFLIIGLMMLGSSFLLKRIFPQK